MEQNQETKQKQKPALDRCFFGQKSALKAQYNEKSKSIYIGVGRKNGDDKWSWNNAKIKDTEAANIIRVIIGKADSISFFHTFKENNRKIWINRKEEQLFFKIDDNSKGLNPGEQEVLKIVLLEAIRLQVIPS